MAGPSVMVKILGDVTGLGKSADEAGAKVTSASSRMHEAFGNVLGQLNQAGVLGPFGEALETANSSLEKMKGHANEVGPAMMGAGAAVGGLGLALEAAGSKDQAAHQQLQAAVAATGKGYDKYGEDVEAAIKKQEKFGTTANTTQDALRVLTQATGDPKKALEMLGTASDLAAAKHEDLGTAAESLGKVYNGQTRVLKEFGVAVVSTTGAHKALETATKGAESADKSAATANQKLADVHAELAGKTTLTAAEQIRLRDATATAADASDKAKAAHLKLADAQKANQTATGANGKEIDALGKKLSGQASAQADTFGGHIKGIKAAMEDHISVMGQKYGPALAASGAALTGVGAALDVGKGALEAYKNATKDQTAMQWLLNAAEDANPMLLIIIGVAALVAGLILLYKHSQLFRDIIAEVGKVGKTAMHDLGAAFDVVKQAAEVVFNWIKANWPLLVAILLGPFAVATLLILENWKAILKFFEELPGKIAGFMANIWDTAFAELKTVATWLYNNVWTPMAALFSGFPRAIAGIFVNVYDTAFAAFTTVTSWLYGNVALPVVNFFRGIPGTIGGVFVNVYDTAFAGFKGAAAWMETNVGQPIINFFTGIPGRIASAAVGMWNGIETAFKSALNGAIDGWNSLKFTTPSVDILGVHTPSVTIGVPQIPHLAQGGLITSTGIVYAHAGEVISPAPAGVGGPAVHIDNVNVSSELDIDLFMRRAAWAARTASL